jgi:Ca2+-binding RTX toxin-like protein
MDDFSSDTLTNGVVTVGDSVTGNIETSGDRDWFRVDLVAGTVYAIYLNGLTLPDSYLSVYDAAGNLLDDNDDGGAGFDSFLHFTPEATNTYFLEASDISNEIGTYILSVNAPSVAPDFIGGLNIDNYSLMSNQLLYTGLSLTNIGLLTGIGSVNVYLSYDAVVTTSDIDLGGISEVWLDPAESDQFGFDTLLAPNLSSGTYYVSAIADSANSVIEGDEINNVSPSRSISVTVAPTLFTENADAVLLPYANAVWEGLGGNDVITGTNGFDLIYGGLGNDTVNITTGLDRLFGGDGIDVLNLENYSAPVTVQLGRTIEVDNDLYFGYVFDRYSIEYIGRFREFENVLGTAFNDVIGANDAANVLDGGNGIDGISFEISDVGVYISLKENYANTGGGVFDTLLNFENAFGSNYDDTIEGSADVNELYGFGGIDTASYYSSVDAVVVDLSPFVRGIGGDAEGDTFQSIENILGSNTGDDVLKGYASANFFNGNGGSDTLIGLSGDDSLHGGEGDDIIDPGTGSDYVVGGGGVDTLDLRNSIDGVGVHLAFAAGFKGDALGDGITGIENVIGTGLADIFYGEGAANKLEGFAGADEFHGSAAGDIHDGGADNDTSYYRSSAAGVTVTLANSGASVLGVGGDADGDMQISIENIIGTDSGGDILTGNDFGNFFNGNGGADVLNGGGGNDSLFGGYDVGTVDTFVFSGAGFGFDSIGDFVDGLDKIEIQGVPGVTSFANLTITQLNASLAFVGINGDANSGISVQGNGAVTLTESDFVFN